MKNVSILLFISSFLLACHISEAQVISMAQQAHSTYDEVDSRLVSDYSTEGYLTPRNTSFDLSLGLVEASFENLNTFLSEKVTYPQLAEHLNVEGTVVVELTISATGEVIDIKVLQKMGYGGTEAALNALHQMPNWKPASNYGVPVTSKVLVEVVFELE